MHVLVAVDWHVIWLRIFHPDSAFARALWATIYISIVAQVVGILFGLVAALARMSRFGRSALSASTCSCFAARRCSCRSSTSTSRSACRTINFGAFSLTGEVAAGILALSINEGAYMREIIRAGIDSIERGQMEAAKSLGMRNGLAMRR